MTDLLLDTSVAIPLVLASHEAHEAVTDAIGARSVALAGHAAFETYAVLTRLPGDARLTPADSVRLMDARFEKPALLDAASSRKSIAVLADHGITGGATYDGLVALAAARAGLTLASRDLRADATYRRVGVDVELLSGSQTQSG